MAYLESEIVEFVECIWETSLQLPIAKVELAALEEKSGVRQVIGIIPIDGEFSGGVVVQVEESLAIELACAMLAMPMDALESDDIQDALGEISNMVAGNVKAILPGPSRLALPMLVRGLDCSVAMPEAEVVSDVAFECQGASVRVHLLKRVV